MIDQCGFYFYGFDMMFGYVEDIVYMVQDYKVFFIVLFGVVVGEIGFVILFGKICVYEVLVVFLDCSQYGWLGMGDGQKFVFCCDFVVCFV